ncbi:MAG: glycosyltransferase family 2 protein [Bacteroidales bacterium]|nr:glycosyltransferase family 2 protein [Bacteroidales bacterium]MCD8394930.1 glycosyltransferase family 2 protein [Bacteroidales bacterium]
MERKRVSIVIPMYNEQEALPALRDSLESLMSTWPQVDWEIMAVNDGSRDNTLVMLRQWRADDPRVHFIDLSRNFGKERAMMAGLAHATGDAVVIIDADLQDPPEMIPEMISWWQQGYDDIYARRRDRGQESWLRRNLSLAYYKLLSRITSMEVLQNTGDFRLLDRRCVDALNSLPETERYTKGLFSWIGFKKKELQFDRKDRVAGKSHWSMAKLISLGMDGITSSTTRPLKVASILGLIISAVAFVYMVWIVIKTLVLGESVQGFPTLMVTILFLGGVQLLTIGIIGEYVGRIFNETKRRPPYIIREIQ